LAHTPGAGEVGPVAVHVRLRVDDIQLSRLEAPVPRRAAERARLEVAAVVMDGARALLRRLLAGRVDIQLIDTRCDHLLGPAIPRQHRADRRPEAGDLVRVLPLLQFLQSPVHGHPRARRGDALHYLPERARQALYLVADARQP